jgi:hypothetical protein
MGEADEWAGQILERSEIDAGTMSDAEWMKCIFGLCLADLSGIPDFGGKSPDFAGAGLRIRSISPFNCGLHDANGKGTP